ILKAYAAPAPSLEPSTANQIRESRVAADRIEIRMYFEELQNIRLLFIRLLEPDESLVVFAQSEISVHKRACGNVTCFSALLQFRQQPHSIPAPPGARIRPDQH